MFTSSFIVCISLPLYPHSHNLLFGSPKVIFIFVDYAPVNKVYLILLLQITQRTIAGSTLHPVTSVTPFAPNATLFSEGYLEHVSREVLNGTTSAPMGRSTTLVMGVKDDSHSLLWSIPNGTLGCYALTIPLTTDLIPAEITELVTIASCFVTNAKTDNLPLANIPAVWRCLKKNRINPKSPIARNAVTFIPQELCMGSSNTSINSTQEAYDLVKKGLLGKRQVLCQWSWSSSPEEDLVPLHITFCLAREDTPLNETSPNALEAYYRKHCDTKMTTATGVSVVTYGLVNLASECSTPSFEILKEVETGLSSMDAFINVAYVLICK